MNRRAFLETSLRSALALPIVGAAARFPGLPAVRGRPLLPVPARGFRGDSSLAAALRAGGSRVSRPFEDGPSFHPAQAPLPAPTGGGVPGSRDPLRFSDLRRHFVFEYYPWYGTDPFRHWDQWDRVPPHDIAATSLPALGAYDSRSTAVLEAHARWMVDSGAGAVNLSWWGPGSFEDRVVHQVMDVFRAHDLRVTFHLEPYADDRSRRYLDDVLYLLREFGEKRRFDAFLVLRDADGREGPVFKGFRTILPPEVTDCRGRVYKVSDYTPDGDWRRQTDGVRNTLRGDFDHVTLLADSLDAGRTRGGGFDGIAIYDNFVPPASYAEHARVASRDDLVFSFNVNPGYDAIEPREIDPLGCYAPAPFVPPTEALDWSRDEDRDRASVLAEARIRESLAASLTAQLDPALANGRRGFLLVYLNSFNEWHEGHAFEPMQDRARLTREERAFGYHNPERGDYRLAALKSLLGEATTPPPLASPVRV